MNKQEIYRKAEQAFNQTFEAAIKSAKMVSKKAGEAAQVTKLLIEKLKLEHRISKNFTELGHRVYDQAQRHSGESFLEDADIRRLIQEAKQLDQDLSRVEQGIERERKKASV